MWHTSKKRGLRSSFWPPKMLQNLPYLWKKKTHIVFFVFHLEQLWVLPYKCPGLCRHPLFFEVWYQPDSTNSKVRFTPAAHSKLKSRKRSILSGKYTVRLKDINVLPNYNIFFVLAHCVVLNWSVTKFKLKLGTTHWYSIFESLNA